MSGIGLIGRRRAIASSPTESIDLFKDYIQDEMILCLDGLRQGDISQGWLEQVHGAYFVNYGAEFTGKGWRFNGSAYMDGESSMKNYGFAQVSRSIEFVVSFDQKSKSSPVLIGKQNGMSFGVTSDGYYAIGNAEMMIRRITPSESLTICTGFAVSNLIIQTALENLFPLDVSNNMDGVWSPASAVRLGATSTKSSYLNGTIYAIRIHNRLLTEEEFKYNQKIDKIRFGL